MELAPERTPQTAMKTRLISGCLRVRSTRGSWRSWKCRWKDAAPFLAIDCSSSGQSGSLPILTLFYKIKPPQATEHPHLDAAALVRALSGEEHGPAGWVGQRDAQSGPGGPSDRAPEGLELDLRTVGERERNHPGTH